MDYQKLKAKIMELYKTQAAFADALGISLTALNHRLNNVTEWRTAEVVKVCALLGIDLAAAWQYFFTEKV